MGKGEGLLTEVWGAEGEEGSWRVRARRGGQGRWVVMSPRVCASTPPRKSSLRAPCFCELVGYYSPFKEKLDS